MWRGYIRDHGYGVWGKSGSGSRSAHRRSFEILVGPIPAGMEVHHKCFNRSCVNPEHLVLLTHSENLKESRSVGAINSRKTHCPQGHPLSGDNLVKTEPRRGRVCRTCNNAQIKERKERQRREGGVLPRAEFCKNGHERTPENTVWSKDGSRRRCLECRTASARGPKPGGYKDPNRVRATHCPHGHEYTPENTYIYAREGREYRYCRECNRQAARRR